MAHAVSEPERRGGRHRAPDLARVAIGIYRFWRDLGYGIGALGLGLTAHFSGHMESAFVFVSASMAVFGAVLYVFGEETHPRLNPAPLPAPNP